MGTKGFDRDAGKGKKGKLRRERQMSPYSVISLSTQERKALKAGTEGKERKSEVLGSVHVSRLKATYRQRSWGVKAEERPAKGGKGRERDSARRVSSVNTYGGGVRAPSPRRRHLGGDGRLWDGETGLFLVYLWVRGFRARPWANRGPQGVKN